jgi:hypothetical protein
VFTIVGVALAVLNCGLDVAGTGAVWRRDFTFNLPREIASNPER